MQEPDWNPHQEAAPPRNKENVNTENNVTSGGGGGGGGGGWRSAAGGNGPGDADDNYMFHERAATPGGPAGGPARGLDSDQGVAGGEVGGIFGHGGRGGSGNSSNNGGINFHGDAAGGGRDPYLERPKSANGNRGGDHRGMEPLAGDRGEPFGDAMGSDDLFGGGGLGGSSLGGRSLPPLATGPGVGGAAGTGPLPSLSPPSMGGAGSGGLGSGGLGSGDRSPTTNAAGRRIRGLYDSHISDISDDVPDLLSDLDLSGADPDDARLAEIERDVIRHVGGSASDDARSLGSDPRNNSGPANLDDSLSGRPLYSPPPDSVSAEEVPEDSEVYESDMSSRDDRAQYSIRTSDWSASSLSLEDAYDYVVQAAVPRQ